MKIYIVTAGTYSDYGIEAVFTTEEKAKDYIDKYGDYDNRGIEEWETDTKNTDKETALYTVYITPDGISVGRCSQPEKRDTIGAFNCCTGRGIGYEITVETDSAERAKKIALERLAQVKAMPYLYPRLHEECVGIKLTYTTIWAFPTYNFHTKEIILGNGQFFRQ